MSMRRFGVWTNLVVSALLMLVVWTLLVWVASRPALRGLIDLTPNQTNSISSATVDLMRELREEEATVEFHVFKGQMAGAARTQQHAQIMAIRRRLVELTDLLLTRYAAIGGEGVKIIRHDPYEEPAAFTEAAQAFTYKTDDAEAVVVAVTRKGQERRFKKLIMRSDLAFIDLGGNQPAGAPGGQVSMPTLKDYTGEKAISSALKSLLVQGNPRVYVLKGTSATVQYQKGSLDYSRLIEVMTVNGFDVQWLTLRDTGAVPADAQMVMCIEPTREFLPREADALYAYLRRGGRLFMNYGWSAIQDMNPTGGKLGELLGYELSTQPVFHRIPDTGRGGGSLDGTDAVARLNLQLSTVHPTTRRLAKERRPMEVFMGRWVRERKDKPKNVRIEGMLQTGPEGWLARSNNGMPDFRSPSGRDGLRNFVMGISCEVDPDESVGGTPVVGRAVIVSGAFCNNKAFPFFGDFALNICNWMTERKVLLDIATNAYTSKSIDITPQTYSRIRWLMIGYVPGTFLLLGLIMWWRRRH